jgi:PEP-CTERM motif
LLALVDLPTFLSQPNPFQIGESLTVISGSILESPAITFKDLSGIANLPESIFALTPAQIDALSNFTGTATVVAFDQVQPVPEPSAPTLLGAGTLCLLGHGWRWRKRVG